MIINRVGLCDSFCESEDGGSLVEYAVLLLLIATVMVTLATTFGPSLAEFLQRLAALMVDL